MLRLFRNQKAAMDLASTMVGVVIIGIIAGVIAAMIFAVIPWSQDAAAKKALGSVKEAEGVSKSLDSKYADAETLATNGHLPPSANIKISTDTNGACFIAVSRSASGKVFYVTNTSQIPAIFTSATTTLCESTGDLDTTPMSQRFPATYCINRALGHSSDWATFHPTRAEIETITGGVTCNNTIRTDADVEAAGFHYLKNATSISFSSNRNIVDVAWIGKLSKLKSVTLHDNEVRDITPLTKLTELTSLNLYGNPLSSYENLSSFPNLTDLDIGATTTATNTSAAGKDMTPIAGLTKLTTLKMYNGKIASFEPLRNMTSLVTLDLRATGVTQEGMSIISTFVNLKTLDIGANSLTDITALNSLTNLIRLDAPYNRMTTVSNLSNLAPNLKMVNLFANDIVDASSLGDLKNLTSLDLGYNEIVNVNFAAELPNLLYLHLQKNQISNIDSLKTVQTLKQLFLFASLVSEADKRALEAALPLTSIRWDSMW